MITSDAALFARSLLVCCSLCFGMPASQLQQTNQFVLWGVTSELRHYDSVITYNRTKQERQSCANHVLAAKRTQGTMSSLILENINVLRLQDRNKMDQPRPPV